MAKSELGQAPSSEETSHEVRIGLLRSNEDANSTPGMTVYVTGEVGAHISARSSELGYDIPDPEPVINGVVSLTYPDGLWLTGMHGVELYQHAGTPTELDPSGWKGRRNLLVYPYERIIRLEGKGKKGEEQVWQNVNFPQLGERIKAARTQNAPQPPRQ